MQPTLRKSRLHENALLARLGKAELAACEPHLELKTLAFKETLHEQDARIDDVYFPIAGVVSVVSIMERHHTIETATIGREGIVGIGIVLGASTASARALCQIPGEAFAIGVDPFLAVVDRFANMRAVLLRYTYALFGMVQQTAACNRAHAVEQRMSRWLLMTHDRVGRDEFPLTQEFLGQMLGVRRSAVNIAGRALQRAGLIEYRRGRLTVVNRRALEKVACGCYAHMQQELSRALGAL